MYKREGDTPSNAILGGYTVSFGESGGLGKFWIGAKLDGGLNFVFGPLEDLAKLLVTWGEDTSSSEESDMPSSIVNLCSKR